MNCKLRHYIKVWFMAPEFAGVARGMYKKAYLLMNEAGPSVIEYPVHTPRVGA